MTPIAITFFAIGAIVLCGLITTLAITIKHEKKLNK